jgi:hypothetical protein
MPAPKKPAGLKRSATLWADVTGKWQLRPDELRLLEDACRTCDLIDLLQAAINSEGVTATGSQGQTVTHPAVTEIRQHRAVLKQLVTRLALPDAAGDDAGDGRRGSGSDAGRQLAHARWGGRRAG